MDEPTASLDAASRERFFSLMGELPQATTLLLCSHRLEELRTLASRVIALDEGRVTYDGDRETYLTRPGLTVIDGRLEVSHG
jgi:energy-coupling factor transporter ATP-binding protein EcfA2